MVVLTPLPALWEWKYAPEPKRDDRGQSLMHAEALAEGRPYTDIDYIYSQYSPRTGPRIAPLGWTLTLVPPRKISPRNLSPIAPSSQYDRKAYHVLRDDPVKRFPRAMCDGRGPWSLSIDPGRVAWTVRTFLGLRLCLGASPYQGKE